MVKPDVRYNGDEMDIRAYVKVKCVAWGQREESRWVEGEVCSLKLAHKAMAANIHKPRIALVAESIMFKDRNTMVSLESIQLQEAEYVKNVIGKLLDSRPNIVLVEKTVSNLGLTLTARLTPSFKNISCARLVTVFSTRTMLGRESSNFPITFFTYSASCNWMLSRLTIVFLSLNIILSATNAILGLCMLAA